MSLMQLNKLQLKADVSKSIVICFLLLRLCIKEDMEEELWRVLKNPSVKDDVKSVVLNVLKDLGNTVDYEKIEDCFENPEEVIDEDTKKLLQTAIINPEAQIDFVDFLNSLSLSDQEILLQSLGDDYTSDSLANILNPIVLYNPDTKLGQIAIDILGTTRSQLAFYTLEEASKFVEDEITLALIKRNISKLKISGIREEKAEEFYKNILASKPYEAYTNYPDGHGNQAVIFSRERENETIQMMAIVVNDTYGLVDCFGFNEISKIDFERIVNKFYDGEKQVKIDFHLAKKMLSDAQKLTRKNGGVISYEYICWKTILSDIEEEHVPIELTLKSRYQPISVGEVLEEIYDMDFLQKWFFNIEYNADFRAIVENFNFQIKGNNFEFDLEKTVKEKTPYIFTSDEKNYLDKRLLMSAYLKYLAGENDDAQKLYSMYLDEDSKQLLSENIVRKSIYEYYVMLKFKSKEENKMTNIFALRNNKKKTVELTPKQIELMIGIIEGLWVKE